MKPCSDRWETLYTQAPLCQVPQHFGEITRSPFLLEYLTRVPQLCPIGGSSLETGIGSDYGAG